MPSWERKLRVVGGWIGNVVLGRDVVSLSAVQNPRAVFEEFASRPKPAAAATPPAKSPVAKAPAAKAPAAKAPTAPRAPRAPRKPTVKAADAAAPAPEVPESKASAAKKVNAEASASK
jgi:NADH dehydrogenase